MGVASRWEVFRQHASHLHSQRMEVSLGATEKELIEGGIALKPENKRGCFKDSLRSQLLQKV